MKTLEELKALANGDEVWLDAADWDQYLELIPSNYRFSSTKHDGDNFRFPLTAPLTTVFRKREALS